MNARRVGDACRIVLEYYDLCSGGVEAIRGAVWKVEEEDGAKLHT